MYSLAKFWLHMSLHFGVTALQVQQQKDQFVHKVLGNEVQALTKTIVTYKQKGVEG